MQPYDMLVSQWYYHIPTQKESPINTLTLQLSCGHEFCYACGLTWKSCTCPLWHENRLVAMANQAVDDEVAPNVDVAVRDNVFNHMIENLHQHEDVGCEHYRNSQWAWRNWGSLQCEACNNILHEYIFMCKNCRMRACNRCRGHRLRWSKGRSEIKWGTWALTANPQSHI